MNINIFEIKKEENERLEIYCHKINNEITEIVRFVKSRQGQLTGVIEGAQYEIPVSDVFYIEGVDNKVFIYCETQVYETRQKLYELEEALKEKHFLRVSKSVLLNLMKIESIQASLNGRFAAVLQNGEQVIVSRKYVPELKKALKGEKV
ncbi:MAG: LytTR family transcriptional regulator DNA-binding domain-containing protein [Prevotella sp.]|nr:LytTR family transcriptional regulator DNA-binding domain-containing protein [Prevotella sp.]